MTIKYEEIANRAFEIWQREGEIEGQEQAHWVQAEEELRKEKLKEKKGKRNLWKDPAMLRVPRSG